MEHWQLDHPSLGILEIFLGTPAQLREVDPNFPQPKIDTESLSQTLEERESTLKALNGKLRQVLVTHDGVPIYRGETLSGKKIGLSKPGAKPIPVKDDEYSQVFDRPTTGAAAYLQLETNAFDTKLIQAKVKLKPTASDRGKTSVVYFDPPAGSFALKRAKKIEASPVKRWLFPLLGGLGKAGWAIFALVVLPILSPILDPVFEWLWSLLPDIQLPKINWPSIPWPDIHLPRIPWPEINLPVPPWWVDFMLEYTKVWVPVVVGIVVGVLAVRNAKKSRAEKLRWERQRFAQDLRALYERRKME